MSNSSGGGTEVKSSLKCGLATLLMSNLARFLEAVEVAEATPADAEAAMQISFFKKGTNLDFKFQIIKVTFL